LPDTSRRYPNSYAARSPGTRAKELAAHARFSVATDVPVYFCDPSSPWQRGSNENTNGLLRQYFPKRSNLAPFSQHDLDAVAAELNERPRQTPGWMTPSEALDEALLRPHPIRVQHRLRRGDMTPRRRSASVGVDAYLGGWRRQLNGDEFHPVASS
jgi:IS30 family transposase